MDDIDEVYAENRAIYQSALADYQADYMRAQANRDLAALADAARGVARTRVEMRELDQMYQEARQPANPSPQQAGTGVGLTPDEAAKICGVSPDKYNEGVLRLHQRKANGFYKEGQH